MDEKLTTPESWLIELICPSHEPPDEILPFKKATGPITLLRLDVDLYYRYETRSILIGRMFPALGEGPHQFDSHGFTLKRYLDIRYDEFLQLIDRSHRGDITLEFRATPLLSGSRYDAKDEQGSLVIPHSAWLDQLNRTGLDRYELISIRIPVSSSHLHKPFADALEKIREAERQYLRGDWNGAAAACRGAWRTILSSAPPSVSPFEHLISPVSGDPRRREFALALVKGVHDVMNKAVHLEGDVKTGTPPADLKPEDAGYPD